MSASVSDLAAVADAIRGARGKIKKVEILAALFARLPEEEFEHAASWFAGQATRRPLAVGFAALEAAGTAVSGASPEAWNAAWLRWSDTGDALGELIPPKRPPSGLSVIGLAHALNELADVPAGLEKTRTLIALLAPLSAAEARFVAKVLTAELRIGLSEGLVLEAIAKAAELKPAAVRRAYQHLGDLGRTALAARRGEVGAERVEPFTPVKPMLATPEESAAAIGERMPDPLWVEDKFDGIRAQAHRSPDRSALYSRTLSDVSGQFPEVLAALAQLPGTLILDGELLAHANGVARPFFDLQKRLGRKSPGKQMLASVPVALFAFDLLYQDGESLVDHPFSERRARLEALPAVPGLFVSGLARVAAADLDVEFGHARARANEGLMVKDPASTYSPGRRGMSWLKYKKALEPLDVVVTGVEYGHGRRREVLSDYSFAVRDTATGALVNLGKAYSGLTDAEILEMTKWFLDHTLDRRGRYLKVEASIVIEVAFEALQLSPRHASGFALRFPRIVRLRPDRTPNDIATLDDVRQRFARYRATYDAPKGDPT